MNNCDVIDLIPYFMTGDVYILLTNLTDINRERNIMRTILLYSKQPILFMFGKKSRKIFYINLMLVII